jgi:hypothetical protein
MLWLPFRTLGEIHFAAALLMVLAFMIGQFVYLAMAIRRFYFAEDTRRFLPGLIATVLAFVLYVVNSVFVTGIQMLGGALALLSLSH